MKNLHKNNDKFIIKFIMLLSDIVKMIHAINTINQNKAINEEKTN